ncbi:MAG: phospholipase/carboxylesterase, partial [Candidatus Paceibacteria bacterium]
MPTLDCIEIEPAHSAQRALIWLHGLGANGHDFEAIVPELRLPPELSIRYIFPNAPSIPVTINGGVVMPAWYDILSLDIERELDMKQLTASSRAVHELIDREIERGIPSERILIAGFSQGGAVNYEAALTYPKPLAGLLALSTYFATAEQVQLHSANSKLPIFVAHGSHDSVVPEVLGSRSVEALRGIGFDPVYRTYRMEHQVCGEEIVDISTWIQQIFPVA